MSDGDKRHAPPTGWEAGRPLLAASFPVAAFALQWLFWEALEPYVWAIFYPAVFFSCWAGGRRACRLATGFSVLAVWFFFIPMLAVPPETGATVVAGVLFGGTALFFSLFHERLTRANRQAETALAEIRAAKEHLEQRIQNRTAELQDLVVQLRRKEADLRKSQELAKIGSWSFELGGDLTWSDELYRIYGLPPELRPNAETFFNIVHPDDRPRIRSWVASCLAGEAPGEHEFRAVRPDGTIRFISGRGELSRGEDGRPVRVSGTAQDITERVEAESALRDSEERLRLFIEYAPVPLAMFDRQMRYLYASRRWRSDYRLGDQELSGKSHYDVFPEIPGHWKELHRRGMAGETLSAEADQLVRADGSVQWIRWEIRPWYGKTGKVAGILIFSEDVTERKQAEEELQRLNEALEYRVSQRTRALDQALAKQEAQNAELQEAYQDLQTVSTERIRFLTELRKKDQVLIHQSRLAAMGEMLGYIAHQWRQPLNVLGLNLQTLGLSYKHGSFSGELLDEHLAKAMEIIKHLSHTIDDFRNFLVVNKEKTTFRVNEVIEKTVGLIRENLEKEGIAVSIVCDGEPLISGYPNEYGHVILNLLTNARDALQEKQVPQPRITLSAAVEGKNTQVTVTDNAGGIDEEIMEKIFDAYFTTKELGKGSGVGLFMSKMIIEKNMGGHLTVRNVNGGAEFRIEVKNGAAD